MTYPIGWQAIWSAKYNLFIPGCCLTHGNRLSAAHRLSRPHRSEFPQRRGVKRCLAAPFALMHCRRVRLYQRLCSDSVPSTVRTIEPRIPTSVCTKIVNPDFEIRLDRTAPLSLVEQIRQTISRAIESGLLAPGTRLPSWQDLAAQLGVARGTIQTAYERLADAQLVETFGAGGTRVAPRPYVAGARAVVPRLGGFMRAYEEMNAGPAIFQLGVPAFEGLPDKLFSRARSSNLLKTGHLTTLLYPDPRGEFELRREIASHLSIARSFHCHPEQVFVTSGYSSGLGLALRVLGLDGKKVWMEEPGFMVTRKGLELARLNVVLVPVDADGLNVDHGLDTAADAALVVLTPGQQAPLGPTLSLRRRLQLLEWASSTRAWIIEDDYLGELQLEGRPAPAMASLGDGKRVIHIGSFSKTVSPALRLGFVVAPTELVNNFSEVAATLAPAPSPVVQLAAAQFMREGHYIRRVRRLKRLYTAQRDGLCGQLRMYDAEWINAGLAVLLRLPEGASDVRIVREAMTAGMAPSPLSMWFGNPSWTVSGLLLGVATAPERYLAASCRRLFEIIDQYRQ
ncbi:transcriptional regulator [Caballeronia glebae]|uniref:Transcriptional regulator n=2 Tax=Caballeronia glebae TaxID=1777143 RepID=A0A158BRP0_9BURK|nr:transcriptional regulator [Caballeronia glebae]